MKHGALGYDLSMAVGDRLFKLFDESKTEPGREREQRLRHPDQRWNRTKGHAPALLRERPIGE